MAKQKIVVKVGMEDARKKSQAFVVAVGFEGFISAETNGETMVIIGDGMDAAELTRKLRKKVGYAELSGVTAVEEKKEEKKPEKKEDKITPQNYWTYQTYGMAPEPFFVQQY